jgi:hypothetical protein
MEHFLDEHGLEEILRLYSDRPAPLFVKLAHPLLHSAGVR